MIRPAIAFLLVSLAGACAPAPAAVSPAHAAGPFACAAPGKAWLRTVLYFGLAKPAGTVSEDEWQQFVRDEVTPRFPAGLTSWEVDGQWRGADGVIVRERSKVLLLVHDDDEAARGAVQSLIERYKSSFEQESVLWETLPVCVAF